jgi:hypothetical protein
MQAPFQDPITWQLDGFLAVFNANRNVMPRTVECLTTLYPKPDKTSVRHLTLFVKDQCRFCVGCTNNSSYNWIKYTNFDIYMSKGYFIIVRRCAPYCQIVTSELVRLFFALTLEHVT